jgi:integrase/recombinase XerD
MGKGCKERMIPTTVRCMNAICDYIDLGRVSHTHAVFVKSDGLRITRRGVGDMLKTLSHTSGIKHVTPHTLRRSCATSLMNRGVEVELIQSLLGHQNLSTTQQYLSISQDRLADAHKRCHPFGEKHEV